MGRKPHCCEALAALRPWVTVCVLVGVTSLLLQMLIFGVVHFTDVRWTSTYTPPESQAPTVVESGVKTLTEEPESEQTDAKWALGRDRHLEHREAEAAAIEVNRVRSRWDVVMSRFQDLSAAAGIVAIVTLCGIVQLGIVLGAGHRVPGIEKAVSAAGWSIVVVLLGVPLQNALPSLPFDGVFRSYSDIAGSETQPGASDVVLHLVLPICMVVMLSVIALRFRAGIERGVIVQSVNELDEELERELSTISRTGMSPPTHPRSVGALNQALGSTGTDDDAPSLALERDDDRRPI